MNVLMVVGNYFPESCGGTQVFTQVLSEGLINRGYKVSVLCMGKKDSIEYIKGVRVYRIVPFELCVLGKSRFVRFINKCLHIYNPFNSSKIKKILLLENPDIVHIQMVRMITPIVTKIAANMNIKIVCTLHELFSLWNFNPFATKDLSRLLYTSPPFIVKFYKKIHRSISSRVSVVTAPSEFVLKKYLNEGYFKNAEKILINNSIPFNTKNVDIAYKRKKEGLKRKKTVNFLYIGRVDHYKGIELMLKVFIDNTNPNLRLYIAGTGVLEGLIADSTKRDKRIKYFGFVYADEKEELFKQCDVLLFPSTYPETFGLSILEAYINGLVVIGSDVGAVAGVIEDKKTGLLIKPNDYDSLLNAIQYFSVSSKIIKHLAYCREILKKYTFSDFLANYETVYKSQW
jgi:glycosyltransferase involved in cell wall biosynthesis